MKEGITISELAKTVDERRQRVRDFEVNTKWMEMDPVRNRFQFPVPIRGTGREETLTVDGNQLFHDQVADRVGIPLKYYQRMRAEAPGLLAQNVNTWFTRTPETRLVRSYRPSQPTEAVPGTAPQVVASVPSGHLGRAFLSDRYRPLAERDGFAFIEKKNYAP